MSVIPDDMDAARRIMDDIEAKEYHAKSKGEAGPGNSSADRLFSELIEARAAQPHCPHCGRSIVRTENASWKKAYLAAFSEIERLKSCLSVCRASLKRVDTDVELLRERKVNHEVARDSVEGDSPETQMGDDVVHHPGRDDDSR